MPFRLLKKGKFIFSSAFPKVLEVHTSTPSKTRSFCFDEVQCVSGGKLSRKMKFAEPFLTPFSKIVL